MPPPRTKRAISLDPSALRGQVALITGASRGIGLALARELAQYGCHLILTSRTSAELKKLSRELTSICSGVLTQPCDVRDPGSVHVLFGAIRKQFGRLDVLINNAGISHPQSPVGALSPDFWRDVIDTNLTGTFLVTQAALPLMKRGATIINNLSISARRVFPGTSAYTASKHGALGLTNTLREELRPAGIRVIALLPGATDTDIWNVLWPDAPRKQMMSPQTVAASVVAALLLPPNSTVEEITIAPTGGAL